MTVFDALIIRNLLLMQNRQLQRELRGIVQGLKGVEIVRVMEVMEEDGAFLNKNFTKSGVNCTCCSLVHDQITVTGFGRNQQQAFINAAKNYLQTLVTKNTLIPQLKNALKLREAPLVKSVIKVTPNPKEQSNETMELQDEGGLGEMSMIGGGEGGCGCIYYEVHKHHMAEIRNMEARMKLIVKENEMLKQLLLKDGFCGRGVDKENIGIYANFN